jgi:hypothetical protein
MSDEELSFSGLPSSCPPIPLEITALSGVFRILQGSSPVEWDWLSHRDRGMTLPEGGDECRFAGLSLFKNPKAAKKLKNLQHLTHAARMEYPHGTGAHATKGNHTTFWIADGKKHENCLVAIVSL